MAQTHSPGPSMTGRGQRNNIRHSSNHNRSGRLSHNGVPTASQNGIANLEVPVTTTGNRSSSNNNNVSGQSHGVPPINHSLPHGRNEQVKAHPKPKKPPADPNDPRLLANLRDWLGAFRLHKYMSALEDLDWHQLKKLDKDQLLKRGVTTQGAQDALLRRFEEVDVRNLPAPTSQDTSGSSAATGAPPAISLSPQMSPSALQNSAVGLAGPGVPDTASGHDNALQQHPATEGDAPFTSQFDHASGDDLLSQHEELGHGTQAFKPNPAASVFVPLIDMQPFLADPAASTSNLTHAMLYTQAIQLPPADYSFGNDPTAGAEPFIAAADARTAALTIQDPHKDLQPWEEGYFDASPPRRLQLSDPLESNQRQHSSRNITPPTQNPLIIDPRIWENTVDERAYAPIPASRSRFSRFSSLDPLTLTRNAAMDHPSVVQAFHGGSAAEVRAQRRSRFEHLWPTPEHL